jgi:hypothetical protein
MAPASASTSDLSQFLVAAWVKHPDLIPNEVGGIVPEPVVDVSYAAPKAQEIVNVSLHREYSPGIVFIFS